MQAVVSVDHALSPRENRLQIPVGSVLRLSGSWEDYCQVRDGRGDASIPRVKYRNGEILLMSPLPRHGREVNILADIVKALLEHQGRNYEAFTPITMDRPEVSGIEPDYCFYINNWQTSVGKDRINWQEELPPDLAIEIDVTSYTSVSDFLPYQVPEVWLLKKNQLTIYQLKDGEYEASGSSLYFPDILLQDIIDECFAVAKESGTGAAISQFRRSLK
jgi:Uma2 family endonuclease